MNLRKMSKIVSVSLLLLGTGVMVFAGGQSASPATGTGASTGAPVTISFMGWGNPSEIEIFKQMISDFEKANPNVKVEYNGVPSADFLTKLQAMVAGGTVPDAFYFPADAVMQWSDAGIVLDLTSYIQNAKTFDVKNVWSAAIDRYRYDGNMPGQGPIWALPKDVGPFALAYNKTLFQQKGVPLPDPDKPWTFDEFITYGQQLTGGSGNSQTWAVGAYVTESAIWANGADWLDASKTKITINTPEFIEAMQYRADLINKYHIHVSAAEDSSMGSYDRWRNGQIAMFPAGPWDQPAFWELPFEWDLMPWPTGRSGKSATWLGSLGLAVSSKSKHPQEAFDLISYFAFSEAGQRTNYQMGQAVPNIIDMAKGEFLQMDKAPKNRKEFLDIIESYGRRYPQEYTYDTEWWTTFNTDADRVWMGQVSAEQFCREMQPVLQDLLDKSVAKHAAAKARK